MGGYVCACDWSAKEKDRKRGEQKYLENSGRKFSKFDENYKCTDSKSPIDLNTSNKEKNHTKRIVTKVLKTSNKEKILKAERVK